MRKIIFALLITLFLTSCANSGAQNRLILKQVRDLGKITFGTSWLNEDSFAYITQDKKYNNYIQTFNLSTNKKQTITSGGSPSWSNAENIYFIANKVNVYNFEKRKKTQVDQLVDYNDLAISRDSKKLVLSNGDKFVIYNLRQKKLSKIKPPAGYFINKFTWSNSSNFAYILASYSSPKGKPSIWLYNLEKRKYRGISENQDYYDSSIANDGKLIAWSEGETLFIDDLATDKTIYKKTFKHHIQEVAWSRSNKKMAVTFNDDEPFVKIYNIKNINKQ